MTEREEEYRVPNVRKTVIIEMENEKRLNSLEVGMT
jgi:hypothetical protein